MSCDAASIHRIGVLLFAMSLAPIQSGESKAALWHGTYRSLSISGAMEIRITEDAPSQVRVRFAFNGRTADPNVRDLQFAHEALSFRATLGGISYQFRGRLSGQHWSGTFRAMDPASSGSGTWRVVQIDLSSTPAVNRDALPPSTGPFKTGRVTFHWIDTTRQELATRAPNDFRQVVVHLIYPTDVVDVSRSAAYLPDLMVMRGFWNDALFDRLAHLPSSNLENPPLAKIPHRFPVIVFMPGGGQKVLTYSTLLNDLASHGFVVAAIDPAFNAPTMGLPDGTVLRRPTAAESGWSEPKTLKEFLAIYRERVLHWTRDISFVLSRLDAIQSEPGAFFGRFDLRRVGALGHSFGGQAAGTARLLDRRV